jgi:hypothetical protein
LSSQFLALSAIVAQIQYRSNNDGYEQRHSTTTIKELWNIAWQELREMVSFLEDGTFLQQTTPAALPTTAVSGEDYVVIDWPTNAVAIFGVRVKTETNRWRALRPLPTAALHDFNFDGWYHSSTSRAPVGYILKTIPFGAATTETAGKIMIVPVPTGGTYSLWYLEAWTPITSDTAVVSGHAAWIEWTIWQTVIKMRAKDGLTDATYNIAVKERDRAEDRIKTRAGRLSDGLSMEPRNARGDGLEFDTFGLWDNDF